MAKEPKQLNELFHDTLKDIYFAEKKILATLPKMSKAAQSEELKAASKSTGVKPKVRLNGWSRCLQPSIKSLKAKPVRRSLV
jgi:ferritin-like metal-binding protein YciE